MIQQADVIKGILERLLSKKGIYVCHIFNRFKCK